MGMSQTIDTYRLHSTPSRGKLCVRERYTVNDLPHTSEVFLKVSRSRKTKTDFRSLWLKQTIPLLLN
jgi:hypothetical protein